MQVDSASFVFIISLAAVVNGLGIVRWLTGFSEFVRRRPALQITHYWVFSLAAVFQFLLHVLFWWSLWSIRGSASINFLSYLYLLSGPILLFVGTAVLAPGPDGDNIDLRKHYFQVRTIYSTVLILAWLWAVFLACSPRRLCTNRCVLRSLHDSGGDTALGYKSDGPWRCGCHQLAIAGRVYRPTSTST